MRRWITAAMVVVLCGALVDFAEAQRFGRGQTPAAGACFYEDIDFQGDYFCIRAGDVVESLPRDMNDRISSIRTFGRVEVSVFQNSQFNGRAARFEDVNDLRRQGWNDRISSLRVESLGGYGRRDDRDRGGFGGRGNDADRIVRRAYEDILNREPDEQGRRLYRSRIIDEGWTEQQVREALRNSPEYRTNAGGKNAGGNRTMTRERATDIVRRAYQNVLNREPDPAAEGYVGQVMQGATQADVERELRRSAEYRQVRPR